jgi:Uma2 family endonuclease
MPAQIERHLFTASDYHKMVDVGIIKPNDRIELIRGQILKMSPIRSLHASIVDILNENLVLLLHRIANVRVQNPIRIGQYSEPEPDIAVVKHRKDRYRTRHPRPEDVLLLIEVADTSLQYDREIKLPLYAEAGIAECWIVNIPEKTVEIYRSPKNGEYQEKSIAHTADTAISIGVDFKIKVGDLF